MDDDLEGNMAQRETKLTVAVPREVLDAVDDVARELSLTRSDITRQALDAFLRQRERARLVEAFARGYAQLTPGELREYECLAEEGQGGANEALALTIGSEDEGEWW